MANTLDESDWNILIKRIDAEKCTPFIGAGACAGTLPLGSDIARNWAKEHNYPLSDSGDLARVSQFLALRILSFQKKRFKHCLRKLRHQTLPSPMSLMPCLLT